MTTDGIVINLEERGKHFGKEARMVAGGPPSEDAVALAFVRLHGSHYRYVPAWRRWIGWNGKRWMIDKDGAVFALIRTIVREAVGGTKHERRIATANYIAGVERMARYDPVVVIQPDALDADPWLLNTQSGIVNLRDGSRRPHDPAALMTRITAAAPVDAEGEELWSRFLADITQGDTECPPICSASQAIAPPA
jgi:putative DNA primase/helicase